MSKKVLIADDHGIVRKGLKETLLEFDSHLQIEEAETGEEALQKFHNGFYHLVLLDISLPGIKGLEILKLVKKESPNTDVLIISMYPEDQYAIRALKTGASGYLTKSSASTELVSAITKIWQGGKYITPSLADKLAVENPDNTHENLSNREYEILTLIGNGLSPKDIADQLKISTKTVAVLRERILNKLNMKTTADLIRYAVKNNLVE